jgi:hypothetical protein
MATRYTDEFWRDAVRIVDMYGLLGFKHQVQPLI